MTVAMVRSDIESAAERIGAAGEAVDGLSAGEHAGQIASALPGSTSAPASTTLQTTWTQEYDGWARRVREHAQAMRDSAADLDETDITVAAGMRPGVPQPI
ncbi:type IV secretory pathway TrbL component [Nocardioides zeae]|uniref:Type IV secretory pathway TrbL component n=2 Tax=Nocardioides zeae TaxID=1457234 RepID=A0AAJ1X3K4_9ACTN|nr:hypothetical protein [Nocardioides zeae]MDQ1105804.1 type IV secretory pathway TrbL component [Nocardioides zeae]MDR6174550.1 type IV secretory pathway TrbL component [Nocardioides zeae]MDR6210622.1 type IV secretory pathway TrbL component [Nocardioides zeae]